MPRRPTTASPSSRTSDRRAAPEPMLLRPSPGRSAEAGRSPRRDDRRRCRARRRCRRGMADRSRRSPDAGATPTSSPMLAAPAMPSADAAQSPAGCSRPRACPRPSRPSRAATSSPTSQESPVKVVAEEPVSTFSIDVDTASYSYVRRRSSEGYVPEPDAVRIEELINYFDYDYRGPDLAETPFEPTVAVFPTPWNPKTAAPPHRHQGLRAAGRPRTSRATSSSSRHLGLDGRARQAAAAQARASRCWSTSSAPTTRSRSSSMPARPAWCSSRPRRPTRRRSSPRSTTSGPAARPRAPKASSSPTSSPSRTRSRAASTA